MGIPTHYLKKRDLLHSPKTTPEALVRFGREFMAAERYSDALDFFEKAGERAAIAEIKRLALAQGDTFLLARLDRFDRSMVSREDWERAAERSEARGCASMANFVRVKFAPPSTGTPAPQEKPGEAPLAEV